MKGTIWLVESHLKFVMRRPMNYSWVRMFTSDLTPICLREMMFICQIFTSDTKEFHFHKRDFDWLIRNFEYSWKRMFTSDLTHGWWRERNVPESTVGYRQWTSVNIYKSGCCRYNGQIFNNNKKDWERFNEHHEKDKRKTLAEKHPPDCSVQGVSRFLMFPAWYCLVLQYLQEIFWFCWQKFLNVYWQNRGQNGCFPPVICKVWRHH
jgi:hypothetical protein